MRNRVCVGALALSFLLSLAALPAAARSAGGDGRTFAGFVNIDAP
jgi:hypothetical protein